LVEKVLIGLLEACEGSAALLMLMILSSPSPPTETCYFSPYSAARDRRKNNIPKDILYDILRTGFFGFAEQIKNIMWDLNFKRVELKRFATSLTNAWPPTSTK